MMIMIMIMIRMMIMMACRVYSSLIQRFLLVGVSHDDSVGYCAVSTTTSTLAQVVVVGLHGQGRGCSADW